MKKRNFRSLTTVAVYWFAIIAGLVLFTATRKDEIDLAGMWIGAVGGTLLGQFLAFRDLRLWFVAVILLAFVVLCGPFTPLHNGGMLFWMALIPGTLCGWLSLSDRGSLVAFWFPVVVWMLTILDRGQGTLKFETGSAALLGSLAFVFIAFLYARETRRISLWRNIAPTPIAPETVPVILKEVPRFRVGAAGWSLAVSTAAFAVCAWLAPRLWHVEPLVPDLYATATERPDARPGGTRCCQDVHIGEQKRARVKEYFDIGRGHDEDIEYKTSVEECVVCGPDGIPMDVARYGYVDGYNYGTGYYYGGNGSYDGNGTGGYGTGGGYSGYGTGGGYSGYGNTPNYNYNAPPPSYTAPQQYTAPTYTPPPEPTYTPPTYTPPPKYTPPAPEVTPPPVEPQVAPPTPEPLPPTQDWEPPARQEAIPADPMPTQPEVARPPPPPQPVAPTVAAPTTTTQAPNAPSNALPFVTWILFVLAGGFAFQILLLSVRPVRRLVTLRHLRRPFWDETVDQRISNWWHLVLVGLRDAGWRTTTGEAPRELAKRLDIAGVEQAAAILDRARHGVGIDQDDLTKMEESSEQAYRASRDRASTVARLLGWFRRPLV